ncbi:phosphoenolpyruvate synthase [Saccharibacillus sp. O16]|nr:phosphoenolpyruvate synthase [Saccharibacillus sp. O16]
MNAWTIGFKEAQASQLTLTGGKGANLSELSRIGDVRVPDGFCVTTNVFRQALEQRPAYQALLDELSQLGADDHNRIPTLTEQIRAEIEDSVIPPEAALEITQRLSQFSLDQAYAVRSSATAEDLPQASFAGQQDTYLNVRGLENIMRHIRRCWASLFTERATIYRIQNGFDHRRAALAVLVQHMVRSQASGILFTADPVTSDRRIVSIEAGFGLGEALVSGIVSADGYKIRAGQIVEIRIAAKTLSIEPIAEGGTQTQPLGEDRMQQQVLTEAQILELAAIGRRIEAHFGKPQDIEWCLDDEGFHIVQSRPITTLFPIPETHSPGRRVYLSTGHQQMMTDAMKPLGLSFFLMVTPAPMRPAGGRLFVDVTELLSAPASRSGLLAAMGQSDPLMRDALMTLLERGDFPEAPPEAAQEVPAKRRTIEPPGGKHVGGVEDPEIVEELLRSNQDSVERLKQEIRGKSGTELLDFIQADIDELKRLLFDPRSSAVIMAGMGAAAWINQQMSEWLGETNAADSLSQSVPGNVTAEMGLALLDAADVIRRHPEVINYLQRTEDEDFLEHLEPLAGGSDVRSVLLDYLDRYGMRCAGEIDLSRTRWSERPLLLIAPILSHVRNFAPGEAQRRFQQGLEQARRKEQELLARLRQLPDGESKAAETKAMIDALRRFSGYREYPKYGMIRRFFVYKLALLEEADRLVVEGVLGSREQIFDLTFNELREVVRTRTADQELIERRQEEFRLFEKLTPPRVLTSDGEGLNGDYRRHDLPDGAIAGLAVSSGVVEGRARVVRHMEDAVLEEGDILVTTFTDPSWTPLFVAAAGLVTEVGGLMTHGAVIAREYGLPAVVGVNQAMQQIRDGQRIRVHGTAGYIELL